MEAVILSRTEGSDFRTFLNYGPDLGMENQFMFDSLNSVRNSSSFTEGRHCIVFVGKGCVCGVAGIPSGTEAKYRIVSRRPNVAFVGLWFQDAHRARMATDSFLWRLYGALMEPIWDAPPEQVDGSLRYEVDDVEWNPAFDEWIAWQVDSNDSIDMWGGIPHVFETPSTSPFGDDHLVDGNPRLAHRNSRRRRAPDPVGESIWTYVPDSTGESETAGDEGILNSVIKNIRYRLNRILEENPDDNRNGNCRSGDDDPQHEHEESDHDRNRKRHGE